MHVISRKILREFWRKHPQAEEPLKAWYALTTQARWNSMHDVKEMFNSADQVGDSRIVFDISGNKYRLVARVSFKFKRLMIKFVGTHAEYDKIDAEKV